MQTLRQQELIASRISNQITPASSLNSNSTGKATKIETQTTQIGVIGEKFAT